jgi:hypothetical protein
VSIAVVAPQQWVSPSAAEAQKAVPIGYPTLEFSELVSMLPVRQVDTIELKRVIEVVESRDLDLLRLKCLQCVPG